MTIGFLVDGQSEVMSLPFVLSRLCAPGISLPVGLVPGLQIASNIDKVVAAVRRRLFVFGARDTVHRIFTVMDFESANGCPGAAAGTLAQELNNMAAAENGPPISVVMKVAKLENWLIADPDAFLPSHFSKRTLQSLKAGNADNLDGCKLLNQLIENGYRKTYHAPRILQKADPSAMEAHSKSFRKLVKEFKQSAAECKR